MHAKIEQSQKQTDVDVGVLSRPRSITVDPMQLEDGAGLFGTCGSPRSTWREDFFIGRFTERGLKFFNPQVDHWTPDRAPLEAEHLANDGVIVLPVSKETHGFTSLAEAGWAIFGGLLRGQNIGLYVESDEFMPEAVKRSRQLFIGLAGDIRTRYPVFKLTNSLGELSDWAVNAVEELRDLKGSQLKTRTEVAFPKIENLNDNVFILGA